MIQVFGSSVGDEELRELAECIHGRWLGMGPKVKEFESAFASRLGLPNFTMLDSGSNALYLAVRLLELPFGSEIIVPSFTWIACAHAITLNGCRPVFCDVETDTQNVSRATIEPHITPDTRAIMVVHYAGRPVDMDPIVELGYPVIEDAAHAVDSVYRGRACGGAGDIGIYSFDAVKNLTTGAGGGITCRDKQHSDAAKRLRYCGIGASGYQNLKADGVASRWWEFDQRADTFIKAIPSDLNAGIGLAQIRKLDGLQLRRAGIWCRYQEAFAALDRFQRPEDASPETRHSYFTYFIRTDSLCRDALAAYLWRNDIYSTLRFHPLHLNAAFGESGHLSNSEHLSECGLNIPLHPALSDEDVEKIIETIYSFYESGI